MRWDMLALEEGQVHYHAVYQDGQRGLGEANRPRRPHGGARAASAGHHIPGIIMVAQLYRPLVLDDSLMIKFRNKRESKLVLMGDNERIPVRFWAIYGGLMKGRLGNEGQNSTGSDATRGPTQWKKTCQEPYQKFWRQYY